MAYRRDAKSPRKTDEIDSFVSRLTRDQEASESLNELGRKGCDKATLVGYMLFLTLTSEKDSRSEMVGFGREWPTVVKRMEQCADDIARFLNAPAGKLYLSLSLHLADQSHPSIAIFAALPDALRRLSKVIRTFAQNSGSSGLYNAVKLEFCKDVKDSTGRWRDREVSALLRVACDSNCNTQSHKMWRTRNLEAPPSPIPAKPLVQALVENLR